MANNKVLEMQNKGVNLRIFISANNLSLFTIIGMIAQRMV
jgi:hypothetical protein